MLTKWGKKFIPKLDSYTGGRFPFPLAPSGGAPYGIKAMIEATDINGNTVYLSPFVAESNFSYSTGYSPTGVRFGNGTTPATDEDYNIESLLSLTNNQVTSTGTQRCICDTENNVLINIPEFTITNSSSEDITISEVCKFASVASASAIGQDTTSTYKYVLIDRTVLDTPLVIEAGTSGVLRYEIKYPLTAD